MINNRKIQKSYIMGGFYNNHTIKGERENISYKQKSKEEEEEWEKKQEILKNEVKTYIEFIHNIKHVDFVPIKIAINKYREQKNCIYTPNGSGNTDKWILNRLIKISNILLVTKIKNKWVCSKQKLDNFNFHFHFGEVSNFKEEQTTI